MMLRGLFRRRFNLRQRIALLRFSGGRCALCGEIVGPGWHADHIQPYATGGPTDVINGQVLCPKCNLQKGTTDTMSIDRFEWQDRCVIDACEKFKLQSDYALTAAPGAGKTGTGLKIFRKLREEGLVSKIVICAHSIVICRQWRKAAHRMGLSLFIGWREDDGPRSDFDGIVVTYQMLSDNIESLRKQTHTFRSLVIFDEVHHLAEPLAWGSAAMRAFELVRYRLSLSGTPFREDPHRMPFLRYEEKDGKLINQPDWQYSYADGLHDGNCRNIYFPHYDGLLEWISRHGEKQSAKVSGPVPRRLESERNRTTLHPEGDWAKTIVREANQKISDCRTLGHIDAAGLIIVSDQGQAREWSKMLQRTIGEQSVIAISDEPESEKQIEKFRNSTGRWIVAVKMISEGVDIPRLRVLVYATITATNISFRQAMGRITRASDDPEDDYRTAFAFLPDREELLQFAAEMLKEQLCHEIDPDDTPPETPRPPGSDDPKPPSAFTPLSSTGFQTGTTGIDCEFSNNELADARRVKQADSTIRMHEEEVAKILQVYQHQHPHSHGARSQGQESGTGGTATATAQEEHQESLQTSRRRINKLIGRLAYMYPEYTYDAYHLAWMHMGGSRQPQATQEELDKKYEWLQGFLIGRPDFPR